VHLNDGSRRRFFAASGYADVTPEQCTVLSDHIDDLTDMSLADAQEALNSAKQAYDAATTDEKKDRAEKLITAAEALVLALQ